MCTVHCAVYLLSIWSVPILYIFPLTCLLSSYISSLFLLFGTRTHQCISKLKEEWPHTFLLSCFFVYRRRFASICLGYLLQSNFLIIIQNFGPNAVTFTFCLSFAAMIFFDFLQISLFQPNLIERFSEWLNFSSNFTFSV